MTSNDSRDPQASPSLPEDPDPCALRHIRTGTNGILIFSVIAAVYFARDFLLPVVFAVFFPSLSFHLSEPCRGEASPLGR